MLNPAEFDMLVSWTVYVNFPPLAVQVLVAPEPVVALPELVTTFNCQVAPPLGVLDELALGVEDEEVEEALVVVVVVEAEGDELQPAKASNSAQPRPPPR
jgi:hypothetical protein